jgi:hypothetical protein
MKPADFGMTPNQILARALRDWLADDPRDAGPPLLPESARG